MTPYEAFSASGFGNRNDVRFSHKNHEPQENAELRITEISGMENFQKNTFIKCVTLDIRDIIL